MHRTTWEFGTETREEKQKVSPTSAYEEHASRSLAQTHAARLIHISREPDRAPPGRRRSTMQRER